MISLSKSSISDGEKEAVLGVLEREYFGMGKEVGRFEELISEFFDRPAACVVNGTAALHLACQAAGIGRGDEVLVQSLTYVASFQAISATGAKPIACDICPKTLTIDWRDAERRITPRTKAIMPVHYSGGVGALDEIYEFAAGYQLRVIEDAAHAFGTRYRGERVGGFGDIACFSFDGIKNITSGEGGCVVSNDAEILDRVRDSRLLGVQRDTDRRYSGERSWDFDVTSQGWRYHMSDIMAAIGIEQIKRFPELAKNRQDLANKYDAELREVEGIQNLAHDYESVVPHIYPVILDKHWNRENLRRSLIRKGIESGVHYRPSHTLTLYSKRGINLPVIDDIYPRLMSLPLHPDLNDDEIKYICQELQEFSSKNKQ